MSFDYNDNFNEHGDAQDAASPYGHYPPPDAHFAAHMPSASSEPALPHEVFEDVSAQTTLYDEPSDYSEADFREVATEKRAYTPTYVGSSQFYAPPSRERNAYANIPQERAPRGYGRGHNGDEPPRRGGGFFRSVALVLACVLCSTAASWGAIQYSIKSGTLPIAAPQVFLGAQAYSAPNSDGLEKSDVIYFGEKLAAEDIYRTAVNQVVCLSTEIPANGWMPAETVYGSGFIISEDGYIITNHHVIDDAHRYGHPLTVTMRDGSVYSATVVGVEPDNDIAVIKINAKSLSPVKVGSSASMQVGEEIYAVGNPRLLDYTMTDGIISALDRQVTVDEDQRISISMFQISAAVNSGNSGGPVYNTRGEVIGVVSAKYMSSGTEGLGFAIPIDDAMDIAAELIQNGYVSGKAKLGIMVTTVDARTAEYYNMVEGVFVKSVDPGSCAEKAGILPGDIITKLGDTEIRSSDELKVAKRQYKANDTASITVFRDGEYLELSITFDEELQATD